MTYSGPARTAAQSLTAIALVALFCAGCSNAPVEPAAGAPNPELKEKVAELVRCMRENGVKDFPDPGPDGSVQYHGDAPESARQKCRDILPGKGNG